MILLNIARSKRTLLKEEKGNEKIGEGIRLARKFYDEKTFNHAMRVAALVIENNMIPESNMDTCIVLAMMHDLLEDTEFRYEQDTETIGGIYIYMNV